jgi:hypothetical protein
VQGDYDKDGTAEPVVQELTDLVSAGLLGKTVTVVTNADGLVLTINKIAYVPK